MTRKANQTASGKDRVQAKRETATRGPGKREPVTREPMKARPYRVSLDDLDVDVTTDLIAELLDVSLETIRRLAQKGALDKLTRGRFRLLTSVQRYVDHLRATASGRGGEDAQVELAAERALLARAQRLGVEMRNATISGEMMRRDDVLAEWAGMLGTVRSNCLSLPGRIRAELSHLTTADIDGIDRIVRRTLEDLANDGAEGAARRGATERIVEAPPAAEAETVGVD